LYRENDLKNNPKLLYTGVANSILKMSVRGMTTTSLVILIITVVLVGLFIYAVMRVINFG